MLKTPPMTQKLKTLKKYSTLSHQPATPWEHTRNVHELLSRGTFREKITFNQILPIIKYFVIKNIKTFPHRHRPHLGNTGDI